MRALVLTVLCALATPALAQPAPGPAPPPAPAQPAATVALLPLDAETRLEIYGQPVASEIARSLAAGGIDVLVVGPKMAVPPRARLVVHGSIKSGKGDAVTLVVGVRRPMEGKDLEEIVETATNLGTIDRAASQIANRVLPIVRDQLARAVQEPVPQPETPVRTPVRPPAPQQAVLVGVAVASGSTAAVEPLRVALGTALTAWSGRLPAGWQVLGVEPSTLGPLLAPQTVRSANAAHGVVFEILAFSVDTTDDGVPLARARVRARIADKAAVVFDRVVVTDTVVGAKDLPRDALAARVAREVLAILRPHLQRAEPTW